MIDAVICPRLRGSFRITKVKAHATSEHVEAGVTTPALKLGNDQADLLATKAVRANPLRTCALQHAS
eukprot:11216140-Alexandrium_andersonii.AAC.1